MRPWQEGGESRRERIDNLPHDVVQRGLQMEQLVASGLSSRCHGSQSTRGHLVWELVTPCSCSGVHGLIGYGLTDSWVFRSWGTGPEGARSQVKGTMGTMAGNCVKEKGPLPSSPALWGKFSTSITLFSKQQPGRGRFRKLTTPALPFSLKSKA